MALGRQYAGREGVKTINIETCADCPFLGMRDKYEEGLNYPYCAHYRAGKNYSRDIDNPECAPPDWCPLPDADTKEPTNV